MDQGKDTGDQGMKDRAGAGSSILSGSPWRAMWHLSWPMLLIMVFNFLVGLVDVYVAGLIGRDVQAAIGFLSQLYFLLIIVANAISIGTVALVSRSFGAGDVERAALYARQSLVFGLAVAVILSALGLLFYRQIVETAGFPPGIRSMAERFLVIYALALGPNYILIISNALFRARGEVKKPLATMFVFCAANLVLDFALVFGLAGLPRLGYRGIAYATAIAATLSMAANVVFLSTGTWKGLLGRSWRPDVRTILRIAGVGWPAGLLQVAWSSGSIVLYSILGKLGSQSIVALASITNGLRIEAVIFMPAFAVNMAASVLVGQNLGAGNPGRAAGLGWKLASASAAVLSALSAVIFFGAEFFASLLTGDPAVLAETARYLRVNMLAEPFMALAMALSGALQGAGDTRGTMWIIVVCMWLIRLPLAFALSLVAGLGALGVWIAMVASMTVQGLLMAYRFRQGKWRTMKVE